MSEKYLLFIHLIFARESNYVTIVQVFCYSLKKRMKCHLPHGWRKSSAGKRLFFIESRQEMRRIMGIGRVDIKSNAMDERG